MSKRQPCSLIPATPQACKKAPNLQKKYTLIFVWVKLQAETAAVSVAAGFKSSMDTHSSSQSHKETGHREDNCERWIPLEPVGPLGPKAAYDTQPEGRGRNAA